MKLLQLTLALITMTMFQSLAKADSVVCMDFNAGADAGWRVEISKDKNSAQVFEMTFAGAELKTTLIGHGPEDNEPAHPNIPVTIHYSEPYLRDAGYSLTFQQGGFVGIGTANLYEVTFFGSNLLTTLVCRMEF